MRSTKMSKEDIVKAVDFEPPVYFIGYGSLMYPSGINGRGMQYLYGWEDLVPVIVGGMKRSFCSVFKELAFYGIYQDSNSEINAIMFEIKSRHDYAMLLHDEGAHPAFEPPLYKIIDVASRVSGCDLPAGAKAIALETFKINEKTGFLPRYYVRGVIEGIEHWGLDFTKKFLETGGVDFESQNFNVKAKYPFQENRYIAASNR